MTDKDDKDKGNIFPGEANTLTESATKKQVEGKKRKVSDFTVDDYKEFLDGFNSIGTKVRDEQLNAKESLLKLDKSVAKEFDIEYSPWQTKVFDTLYSVAGINVYKAGIEKKLDEFDNTTVALKKDLQGRELILYGRTEFVPPSISENGIPLKQTSRIREKDKGLEFKLDELKFNASQLKRNYDLGELRLSELRAKIHDVESSVTNLDPEKDNTAPEKIVQYGREKHKLVGELKKIETLQNRAYINAKGSTASMDALNKLIIRERVTINDATDSYFMSSSKTEVLRIYVNDRKNGSTIGEIADKMQFLTDGTANVDDATQIYDGDHLEKLGRIRAAKDVSTTSASGSEIDLQFKDLEDSSVVGRSSYMADFAAYTY